MSYFITLEGVEGAGKTTLQQRLASSIQAKGHEVVTTREPGATKVGQAIRKLVLDQELESLTPKAELMLFAADRAQHVSEIIAPALNRGAIVICDRYIHSTLAYQGYGRGLDIKHLELLNQQATNGLVPDLVLLLDLDPAIGLSRASGRKKEDWTRFEAQELNFHKNIRSGFLELAKDPKNNFKIIDASKEPEELYIDAINAVNATLTIS